MPDPAFACFRPCILDISLISSLPADPKFGIEGHSSHEAQKGVLGAARVPLGSAVPRQGYFLTAKGAITKDTGQYL
ncbi:hypothetical protein RKLH11_3030 [Rhodobacteraceae bacterium KLH11]|nr:hypothetical protein RKLH11_3030 [Rhodobacteraceae bacterium KLH11]